ncbi:MAG: nitroreductase family protein, partial [Patescibacteria group bacterium]
KFAEYDLGSAVMSIITQAQTFGIYSRQMGLFDNKKLQRLLAIPKEYKPFIVLAVGKIGDYLKIDQDLIEKELQKRERKINISKKL